MPLTIESQFREIYRSIAEFGSATCGMRIPLECSAVSFAAVQQAYGVFGCVATAEFLDCEDLPLYYKIIVLVLVNIAMGLGSCGSCGTNFMNADADGAESTSGRRG
jgi:hypothetical protein